MVLINIILHARLNIGKCPSYPVLILLNIEVLLCRHSILKQSVESFLVQLLHLASPCTRTHASKCFKNTDIYLYRGNSPQSRKTIVSVSEEVSLRPVPHKSQSTFTELSPRAILYLDISSLQGDKVLKRIALDSFALWIFCILKEKKRKRFYTLAALYIYSQICLFLSVCLSLFSLCNTFCWVRPSLF